MKQTAGSLRLDLAQFRELAAFSQFAADLDVATRRQLDRGRRLMQVIKQGVNAPLPVGKQVVILYAGVNGFLDDVPEDSVPRFEAALHDALDSTYADFMQLLNRELALTDEVKKELEALLKEFKQGFGD